VLGQNNPDTNTHFYILHTYDLHDYIAPTFGYNNDTPAVDRYITIDDSQLGGFDWVEFSAGFDENNIGIYQFNALNPTASVPEPATRAMMLLGLLV
jgi:hypothetical protein